jgi:hypothetical protein
MTELEARVECLKLAVVISHRQLKNDVQDIELISTSLYNHLAVSPKPAEKPGLTARADKSATKNSGPASK